ncbi:hypothetical protein J6590_098979 [Homalodisca vitripennis]|nr:hypothetical protein J6590_098979 [Homalodisca vitripennis]
MTPCPVSSKVLTLIVYIDVRASIKSDSEKIKISVSKDKHSGVQYITLRSQVLRLPQASDLTSSPELTSTPRLASQLLAKRHLISLGKHVLRRRVCNAIQKTPMFRSGKLTRPPAPIPEIHLRAAKPELRQQTCDRWRRLLASGRGQA